MADVALTIDPSGTSLALHDRPNGRRLMAYECPIPDTDSQWSSSADTEGEKRANLRYKNRVIVAKVMFDRTTDALLQASENVLGQKIGKLAREGGELRFTYPSGTSITFTVLEASYQRAFGIADTARQRAVYDLTFVCLPFGLGTEVDLGDNTETTLPVLIFTETGVTGDVPGLGRLVIDDDSGVDQWWLTWGIQSRYYSSSANAALFYEAEGRTAMGGSAIAAGPTGASGAGSNVMRNTALLPTYQAILSTQATAAGAHLSHIGTFRAYARVQVPTTNTGEVTVALEWGEGDFRRYTRNTATTISGDTEGKWLLVDLGLVSPREVTQGTQRWEGRIIAKSTVASDDIDVDFLFLVPADEGSGIASGISREFTPNTFSARDDFTGTTSGVALNTRVPVTGAAWATSGAATDFAFIDALAATSNLNEAVSRSVTTQSPRYGVLGSALTSMQVRATVGIASGTLLSSNCGLLARWVDASNHLRFVFQMANTAGTCSAAPSLGKTIAATTTKIATGASVTWPSTSFVILSLTVTVGGVAVGRVYSAEGALLSECSAYDSVLATGGTLASGLPGIYDGGDATNATQRWYDDILVAVPPLDAAIFASQSLEARYDRVTREDSGGTVWSPVSSYEGDYIKVPPAGQEARTTRVIVKASRADPLTVSDPAIDDISARLFVTPRFLVVPS